MDYKKFYDDISTFFQKKGIEKKLITINSLCVGLFGLLYIICIAFLAIKQNPFVIRAILVPASTLVIATLLRRLINRQRPYEKYDIAPLIHKETQRQSFPSRHIASGTILCITIMALNMPAGIILSAALSIMAATRIVGGVHYPSDILAGIALGLICGYIGYCVI